MVVVREILVGRYELLEVLGRGGMGVVYRASDRVLEREVAVKVLPADRADDPAFVARFEREARAAAALNHPNMVGVFDFGKDADTRFIVMEYVAGQNLTQLIRGRGRVDPQRAVKLAAQIARALAAAHQAGIVHRDVKPANVIVEESGTAKVLDFGIARSVGNPSLTQTAVVLGSAPYMAPEVARGQRADERSDIYSLGCVLYELLTGGPPFASELPAAVLHQHTTARPRSPRTLNPDVSAGLDALVLRMLAKRPAERPQTAGRLATELEASLSDSHTSATVRMPEVPGRLRASSGPARRHARVGRSSHPVRLVAAGLAVVALAALVLVLLSSSGGRPRGGAGHTTPAASSSGRRDTSSRRGTTSARTPTPTPPVSPATVPAAAGALETLIAQDLQSGAIDQHGSDLLNHLQDILGSYEQGHGNDAPHKLGDLTKHVADLTEHGDIQASALPAINVAIHNLQAAIARSAR